jgi:short-subunit dehydrogenase
VTRRTSAPQVVVVVGASSGIGRATALAFAKRDGSRLVLAARNQPALEEVAEKCRSFGSSVLVVPTDVSEAEQVRELVTAAVRGYGRIDVWVGCAAVTAYGLIEDTPVEVLRKQTETNYLGWVYSTKAVLPVFRQQRSGHFILIGSIYSKIATPLMAGYLSSKHAAWGFTETLRQELRGSGIHVSAVLPATIDTPLYQHAANYTGRSLHAIPPVVAVDRVARAVLALTRKPRNQVVVGQVQRTLIGLHAMSPRLSDTVARAGLFHIATRSEPVARSDGNVFEPDAAVTSIEGGWRWSAPRRMLVVAGTLAAVGWGTRWIRSRT